MTSLPSPQTREQDSEWIEHDGAGVPVRKFDTVDVRYRDGEEDRGIMALSCMGNHISTECWWSWEGRPETNVIAYRLHNPSPSSQGEEQ